MEKFDTKRKATLNFKLENKSRFWISGLVHFTQKSLWYSFDCTTHRVSCQVLLALSILGGYKNMGCVVEYSYPTSSHESHLCAESCTR